ncbi:MAG: GNAT family N-acetyltransferase [Proteobacteria bacterium]|nr:GNAT family N-acetyltransferase [Pseudomonadota bacterium]
MMSVSRIVDLPSDIKILRDEADGDGIRNMGLLVDEWTSGAECFSKPGEALFGAFDGGGLVGIGGVTLEPDTRVRAMRMRRLYVLRGWRNRGVGRALAARMMQHGFSAANLLTCNTRPLGAAEFWDAMGFSRVAADGRTHELKK